MGMHLNVPEFQLSDREAREHRNRVWWTAYIFDRMWASRLGQPVSIQDDDIEVDLPSSDGLAGTDSGDFGDPEYLIANIRLAKLAGHIIASIYARRRQQGAFSQRVQQVLRDLRNWVKDLPNRLQLDTDEPSQTAPNLIVSLHLSFNQCVVLATRPILLQVLRTYRESWTNPPSDPKPQIPGSALALAETCIRCAQHSYRLLTEAWIDGSFATFSYFNTQYLFSAATILAISSLLNDRDSQNDGDDFEAAAQFLTQLEQNGNFAAKEFCRHIDAMRVSMKAISGRRDESSSDPRGVYPALTTPRMPGAIQEAGLPYIGSMVTAGMALAEPSLQELLSQPDFNLQFMDTPIYDDALQSLYWPELPTEGWMAG
ncbi:hypothetical protein H2201_000274 [Coniosporium apollinis]|uniref:Xylanolytic transcriptional activator regulatory domain-containing protein n=1 Tax=Coniosporium apollinis TaxID=61459 RepID=A0ABQ9P470_9PEZI|nr:hypothetical protein H2201_000274 [Coniosporium apollinis]